VIVDSSALVAIVLGDPDAESLLDRLTSWGGPARVSAVGLVESAIVVEARQGPDATRDLELLLSGAGAEIVPVTEEHATLAIGAWRRFGKGRHPAGLNLGDCFAYAAARAFGEPLLFKGDDFAQTDLPMA
jgi:ribonuclease VapC